MTRALQARRNAVAAEHCLVAGIYRVVRHLRPGDAEAADADERLDDSKQYLRQMEVFGGTAKASEFREWFAGLWVGRRLSLAGAFLSIVTQECAVRS